MCSMDVRNDDLVSNGSKFALFSVKKSMHSFLRYMMKSIILEYSVVSGLDKG